jgi:hypothetical protein
LCSFPCSISNKTWQFFKTFSNFGARLGHRESGGVKLLPYTLLTANEPVSLPIHETDIYVSYFQAPQFIVKTYMKGSYSVTNLLQHKSNAFREFVWI